MRCEAAGWEHLAIGGAGGCFARLDRWAACPDAGRGGLCDAQAQDSWQSHRDLALLSAPQDHLQKKAYAPRSRSARTWRVRGDAGCETRACLIRRGWCSSMRLPPIPRWLACTAVASVASDWWTTCRRVTGRRSPSWLLWVGMA